MPSRRTVCVVNDSSPIAAAAAGTEVLVLPSHSVVPKLNEKTEIMKNSEITPTPPPKQPKQKKLPSRGGGQLTLASFFIKTKNTANHKEDANINDQNVSFTLGNCSDPSVSKQSKEEKVAVVDLTSIDSAQPKKRATPRHEGASSTTSKKRKRKGTHEPKSRKRGPSNDEDVATLPSQNQPPSLNSENSKAHLDVVAIHDNTANFDKKSSCKEDCMARCQPEHIQDKMADSAVSSASSSSEEKLVMDESLKIEQEHVDTTAASMGAPTAVLATKEQCSALLLATENVPLATNDNNDHQVDLTVTIQREQGDCEHHARLEKRYMDRKLELVKRANDDAEANEKLPLVPVDPHEDEDDDTNIFPNSLVATLAALIQGSRLPLSELSKLVLKDLNEYIETKCSKKYSLTSESVAEKIKLIAERKPHFGIHPSNKKLDKLEDTTEQYVWRWELTSVDLLLKPESVSHVKKVRAYRKRLASHYKAIVKLLELKRDNKDIGNAEDRVLKFEREDEAKRLMEKKEFLKKEASEKQKIALLLKKEEEAAKKETEKHMKEQERARLKAQKEEEKRLKDEEKRLKEEEKLKARLEKERLELEQIALAEEAIQKQKALMAKFFVCEKSGRNNDVTVSNSGSFKKESKQLLSHHNVETFWKQLGTSSTRVHSWMRKRKGPRFERTEHIRVSVTVTVVPPLSSGFNSEDQCYSERRIISVPNKLKFLKFFEDYRPPYRGTWSKPKSKFISGRLPFGKDETHLNYEVDSEAEWEEEAEDGEDLDSVAKDDEEEDAEEDPGVDSRNYNYADGWLARDSKCEDLNEDGLFSSWCLVAPLFDGIPILNSSFAIEEERNEYIVGLPIKEALDMLSVHKSIICEVGEGGLNVCMEPYKPVPEALLKTKADDSAAKKEIHADELRSFCQFIHGCTLSSKEKIVEEFRKKYPSILCSRAELFRKLDSISVKHRIPRGGTVWEVSQEAVDELELNDLLKVLDLPKLSSESLVEASEMTGINEFSKSNGSKRKQNTSATTPGSSVHTGSENAAVMSEHLPRQGVKKKKRIVPESLGTQASAALFASFLNKAKVAIGQASSPEASANYANI